MTYENYFVYELYIYINGYIIFPECDIIYWYKKNKTRNGGANVYRGTEINIF